MQNFEGKIQNLKVQALLDAVPFTFDDAALFKIKKILSTENVIVAGSYLLGTGIKNPSGITVDLVLLAENKPFQQKDFRDYRYLNRKKTILKAVAEKLLNSGEFPDFSIQLDDDATISMQRKSVKIRFMLGITKEIFSCRKLAPGRNNLKKENPNNKVTPYYNQSILRDMGYVTHLNFLNFYCKEAPGFRNAVKLGKVWIQQKLRNSKFSGFIYSMILAFLLQNSTLESSSSSSFRASVPMEASEWQMFKVMMEFLASHNFIIDPIIMNNVNDLGEEFTVQEFKKNYDVVIVDPTGMINIGAVLTVSDIDYVKFEAKRTLSLLSDFGDDGFEEIFLKSHREILKFDHFAKIPSNLLNMPAYTKDAMVDFPDSIKFALHYIPKVFKKALTDRFELISITANNTDENSMYINIGVVLHHENALREVEQGPKSDDADAVEKFRRLWGEKSEMRRFKDGSILESVVFPSDGSLEDRANIFQKMLLFLIKRHMGVSLEEGKSYFSNPFFKILKAPGIDSAAQKSFGKVNEAFALLTKQLKSLKELPLSVTSVKMSHPGLYFASAIVPQPHPDEHSFNNGYRPYIEPMDVVIELETSGHWPENLVKIQQMKIAFYLKIAQGLNSLYPGSICRVSIGERDNVMSCGWIDIIVNTGYKFRCRIHSEREKYLLDQEKDSDVSLSKEKYERLYMHLPKHSSKLYNLCLNYPFLSFTIRLMKRWIGVHLLSNHVSDITIELLCASIFVNTGSLSPPGSSWCGFLRVLELIASHDWKSEPLIFELQKGSMSSDLKKNIISKFLSLQSDTIFIATEDDPDSKFYPRIKPIIINRLKALSHSCIKLVNDCSSESKWIKKFFVTPTEDYDFILHLSAEKCSRYRENVHYDSSYVTQIKPKFRNLISSKDRESALLSRIDSVSCYINELENAFSDVAIFFYDKYGGNKIMALWKSPNSNTPWKTDCKFNFVHVESNVPKSKKRKVQEMVKRNDEAILAEIQRLGQGILEKVELMSQS